VTHQFDTDRLYTSDRIDKVLTNRLIGPVIMLAILFGVYQFTFSWSEWPVALLEDFFGWLSASIETILPDGLLKSLVISGVIDGVGGVLGFVPLIMFMFFAIAILEDSGYLARVAYMMDRVFRIFGLHGSSVMPFIVSGGIAGGCAVPGVMATRTLRSPKERMATLLTVPFMNCGAKMPVLALLIGAFFSENKAQYMFLFTMLAWIVALLAARLLRSTVLRGPDALRHGTAALPLSHAARSAHSHLGADLAVHQKGGDGHSRDLDPAVGNDDLPATPGRSGGRLRGDAAECCRREVAGNRQTAGRGGVAPFARRQDRHRHREGITPRRFRLAHQYRPDRRVRRQGGHHLDAWHCLLDGGGGYGTNGFARRASQKGRELEPGGSGRRPGLHHVLCPLFVTVVCIAREASWRWALFSIGFNTVFAFTLAVLVFQIGSFFHLG